MTNALDWAFEQNVGAGDDIHALVVEALRGGKDKKPLEWGHGVSRLVTAIHLVIIRTMR